MKRRGTWSGLREGLARHHREFEQSVRRRGFATPGRSPTLADRIDGGEPVPAGGWELALILGGPVPRFPNNVVVWPDGTWTADVDD